MCKRIIGVLLLGIGFASGALFAAGGRQGGAGPGSTVLNVALSYQPAEQVHQYMLTVGKDYEAANPGVKVEMGFYPDYEVTMKTKMAARDLPDLWATHGWSVARYSEYLEPLNSQSWASKVNPKILPVITNKSGQFFVLPFNVESQGIVVNQDVLESVGVDIRSIKTWDDFRNACAKVKAAGKIPLDIAGNASEDWTVGTIYNTLGQSFLVTNERQNSRNALLDGSFNWGRDWGVIQDFLLELRDKGYLNPDYTQGTEENQFRRLGNGEVAFVMSANNAITRAKLVNPNARIGFIAVPSNSPGDPPTLTSGERMTLGAYKDGRAKAEALKFLEYCSQPAIINRVATLDKCETGLIGPEYTADLSDLKPYFDNLQNIRGFPYFDRAYLPSGMWDALCKTASGLLANTMTKDQAISRLRNDYNDLRAQQQ
ncbi:MAG: extracellular solute-binding protein [Treponema sp.]|jgi:raffinose/stachyose/melibiose transport system substrate-binding protein|nr:extracellular solute-binding protein [Treponema sp.]